MLSLSVFAFDKIILNSKEQEIHRNLLVKFQLPKNNSVKGQKCIYWGTVFF